MGREVNIATDALAGTQVAAVFSEVTGRSVEYVQVPWEDWGAKRPVWLVNVYHWYEQSGVGVDIASLRTRYPELLTFKSYLRDSGWADLQEPVHRGRPWTSPDNS